MKKTWKQGMLRVVSILCLLALVLSCLPALGLVTRAFAASPNTTYKATVTGNAVSIEKSGTRDNSNYAAFEMDPTKDITIEFVGKNMPTVRFLTNEVTNNTSTAGTGALVRGDANSRLEIRNGYGNATGADVKSEMGIDKLVDGKQYRMVYEIKRSDGVNINQVAAVLYESDGNGGWTKTYDRTHNMTVETLGCDLSKPLYVVFYNNLYSDGAAATEFTYLRPSALDESSVAWDGESKTLSWGKLIGADGYFVKLDGGEWTSTEALSHTFTDLSYGSHTLSVCANIGGTQGAAVTKEIELVEPAGPGASRNVTSKATVTGNLVSIENSGTRANSNYAAFEMDPYQDEFTIEFAGKGMPTIRYMTNEISPITDTAGTGSMLRADANNRFEIRHGYGNADGAQVETNSGSLTNASTGNSLEADAKYKLLFRIVRNTEGTITHSNAQLYKWVDDAWVRQFDKSLSTDITKLGVDLEKPVYVIFYNNLAGWTGKPDRTEFTFNRPSVMDESRVAWDGATNTLSWERLAGADGYFVQLDGGEWIETDDLSYAFTELDMGDHSLSVCANIGGVQGPAVTKAVKIGEPVILKDAASIRIDGKSGIRFTAYIAEGYLETGDVAGIVIHKGPLAEDEELTWDTKDMYGTAKNWAVQSDREGYRKFNCVIINVPESYYALGLAARAYISHTEGESTVYEYSDVTATRSLAQVASMALADPQYTNNEVLMGYVDGAVGSVKVTGSQTLGIKAEPTQLTLALTGKESLVANSSVDNLQAIWSTSDASVVTVDENGLVTPKSRGAATVTATVGSNYFTHDMTVGNYRATENANGTLTLNGNPDTDNTAAYYVMDYGKVDVNTLYEISWTGKNFPGLWLGASEERGTYKTTGTGVIVTWDNSYGLAVSSQTYGSGRTPITNQAGQSGANWALSTLDDNTKYVMRVGFVENAESNSEYKLQIYVWSVAENGAMTLLNKKTTSDNYANGVVSDTEYYMLLVNNRAHNPNTFSWRTVKTYGSYSIDAGSSSTNYNKLVFTGQDATDLPYIVTDYQKGDYAEIIFTGRKMPTVRFGYGTPTSNANTAGNGFILQNSQNQGLAINHTGYFSGARTTLLDNATFGCANGSYDANAVSMLRVGLEDQGGGTYKMVAYLYKQADGGWDLQNTTTSTTSEAVAFGEDMFIQIMGNRQSTVTFTWQIKNGGFAESALQFGLYGYAGPSNGQHIENGTTVTDHETGFQNQAGYDTYAAAGMNILLLDADTRWSDTTSEQDKVKEILDYAKKAGLKVIIHDSRINTLSLKTDAYAGYASQAELNAKITGYMNQYATHEAFYGLQIDDEPSYTQFPAIGAVYKAIKAYDPDCYVQCNLLPLDEGSYASYAAGATQNGYETAYTSYLTAWLDATGADYVMFDSYPFLDDQVRDAHVRGFQLAANLCKEKNVELYSVAQAGAWTKGKDGEVIRRAPTEADMYWQTNMLMGMGVKEISYFTYQTKKNNNSSEWFVDGASFVKWDGTTTDLYTSMQKIHSEMQLLAPTILKYDFVDMAVYGKSGLVTKNHVIEGVESASSWNKITKVSSGVGTFDYNSTLFISELYNKATQQYGYMIVNLSEENKNTTMTPTITFSSNDIAVYSHGQRTQQTLTDGSYQVSLNYGEAVFVVVE